MAIAAIALTATFAIVQPLKVLPRIRVAPGYSLTDQAGLPFSSETARGGVTLYTFAPLDCGAECDGLRTTLAEVQQRIATEVAFPEDVDFRIVTVALADAPTPEALAAAAAEWGADGEVWRWVGGDERRVRNLVGGGFRFFFGETDGASVDFDPGFVIVDGNGIIRGEYRFQTISADDDKLVGQLAILGGELRNSNGGTALAYEAAHLFSCYG